MAVGSLWEGRLGPMAVGSLWEGRPGPMAVWLVIASVARQSMHLEVMDCFTSFAMTVLWLRRWGLFDFGVLSLLKFMYNIKLQSYS